MEDLKQIQEFFSKPLEEGKQLDIEDFAKVVQAVTKTGHPVTVLLTPKFNEIEVLTGMDAPDDMLRDLSIAVDSLGYGRNDIIIAGDSSNLSRREYSDIRRVNGGARDYFEESVNENLNPEVSKAVNRFIKAMAKRYDYSEQDAVYAIMSALRQEGFQGLNEAKIEVDDKTEFKLDLKHLLDKHVVEQGYSLTKEHETDPNMELKVGDYQTQHFHMCPGAKSLYQDIENKVEDMGLAIRSAKLQDALFAMEESALENGANEADVFAAETIADQIMAMAAMMGLDKEHSYIQGHVDKIKGALDKGQVAEASYVRVSEPKFVKDKTNPNFLYVNFKYDTGGGVLTALGKETMAGQIRRLSSAEAMKQATALAKDLEAKYNLEDIDVYDKENGVVQIFAVSDDFIDMDPNMLGEIKESLNPEVSNAVNRFIKAMAKRYDYSEQDAVFAIMAALKQRDPDSSDKTPEKKSKFKKSGERAGFDMRGINEEKKTRISDVISRFGMEENMLSLDDQAKAYYLAKVKAGEIDTLPENPKAAFLAQMMKDQIEHDKETLRRERGLEEKAAYIAETIKLGLMLNEELCDKGKRYIKARQAAGEKSSAYLSGRAVRVCKGQIEWPKKGKKKK